MSHTPGPWGFRLDNDVAIITSDSWWDFAEVQVNPDNAQGEANARLIAAAPELLAALEELYHLIDDAHDGDRVFTLELAQKAKAAIAKARGQG
jgi:hypothetical protein